MRIGTVIGRVTLGVCAPGLEGARWLIVSPGGPREWQGPADRPGPGPSLVVFDNLGAGQEDRIGYVEGREAASPFADRIPLDAINVALIDRIFHQPAE